ncbi:hypothetical protein LCGC14_0637650 [marine sediment metagenome]|uniref:Uncharacterized protein n=1 Tax=marine sediment metagenome TaxID=412755 RepID=A0A0F9R5F4_9ZZZZ
MEYLGLWITGTTSATAAATAKTLTDSVKLVSYANDYFNTRWALLTTGTNSAKVNKISDFNQSTGVASLLTAFSAAIAASVTYEFLPYHPTDMIRWAINKALQEVYDKTYRSILNEALITGNALPNGGFEDWASSSVPDHWVLSVATAAKDTGVKKYGRAAVAITGGASAGYLGSEYGTGAATIWENLIDLAGNSLDFEVWIKTNTASHARLQIVDSDGTTSSSYHTGGDLWELLKVTRSVAVDVTSLAFRITADVNTKVTYADHARVLNSRVTEYVLPAEFTLGDVKNVYIQNGAAPLTGNERPCDDSGWVYEPTLWVKPKVRYDDRLGVWLMSFSKRPSDGYKMRLEGREPQTKLTTDSDTVALTETHLNLLYPYAAYVLFEALGRINEAQQHLAKYKALASRVAMPAIPCSAIFPWGRW